MSTTSLVTFADFLELPDLPAGKRELVDGEVVTMPPPKKTHSDIAHQLLHILFQRMDWKRVRQDHTGYQIGDSWLEPDVSILWPDQAVTENDYFSGAPMIAAEVLSPGEDIDEKLTIYFNGGAREVWVVNPRNKTMTAYVKRGDDVVRIAADREYYSDAAGFSITLADIFTALT